MSVHHHHPLMAIRRNRLWITEVVLVAVVLACIWLEVCAR